MRANARKLGAANGSFRLGEIEHLPAAANTANVILSNCVTNLVPDKAQVFREAFRVLKTGGWLAISDVVNTAPLPERLAADRALFCGCVSAAAPVASVEGWLRAAGFTDIAIAVQPQSRTLIATWAPGRGVEEYVVAGARDERPAVAPHRYGPRSRPASARPASPPTPPAPCAPRRAACTSPCPWPALQAVGIWLGHLSAFLGPPLALWLPVIRHAEG